MTRKKKPIWLVAAAGNYNGEAKIENDESFKQDNRDLDTRTNGKFYPACFSNDTDNNRIITASTIRCNQPEVCLGQNYGASFIDVGVKARDCNIYGGFSAPRIDGHDPVIDQGTSFAAPVVAGWLGANADLTKTKDEILANFQEEPNLGGKIRAGRFISN
jgi:hypothetical protein